MTITWLQEKEEWTKEDYIWSLEFLRNNRQVADELYDVLDDERFANILDFEAGWLENFWALPESARNDYQEAFRDI